MPFREITSKNTNNPNNNDEKEHPCVVGQVDTGSRKESCWATSPGGGITQVKISSGGPESRSTRQEQQIASGNSTPRRY